MQLTKKLLIILIVAAVALVACGSADSSDGTQSSDLKRNKDGYVDISVSQLDTMLADKNFVLVNVHVPYEGEIPQTDLFIPFDQIGANLDRLPAKDAAIVLYCRSGTMSTTAAKELASLGYTDVMELDRGFNAWVADGHELIRQP
jgi:rhodanese-related sulfurtransferase